jgi:hypothetical protein
VVVAEVVNSKTMLLDEGAIIKEVEAGKEDEMVEDSVEPATIVRKTATRKREMKVVRQQHLRQANITRTIIIVVMGILIPTMITTATQIQRWQK